MYQCPRMVKSTLVALVGDCDYTIVHYLHVFPFSHNPLRRNTHSPAVLYTCASRNHTRLHRRLHFRPLLRKHVLFYRPVAHRGRSPDHVRHNTRIHNPIRENIPLNGGERSWESTDLELGLKTASRRPLRRRRWDWPLWMCLGI